MNNKVLVVEDDDDARGALCVILESFGLHPYPFPCAKDCLPTLGKEDYALAMLDLMMPEMNGYELMAEIKKVPKLDSLPIIMVTAKDNDAEILEGYAHGADYYITKPYTAKQIAYGVNLFIDLNELKAQKK